LQVSEDSKLNIELFLSALLQDQDYTRAVERALKLAAAYEQLLAKRKWEQELFDTGLDWERGVKWITGQRRLVRAEKSFVRLCAHSGKGENEVEAWRKQGFHPDEIAYLGDLFSQHFSKRKRISKKVLARLQGTKKTS
jgi:hypothetical protein